MDDQKLSFENIVIVCSSIFVAALLFGPIEPYGLVVRVAYLLILPLIAAIVLMAVRYYIPIDQEADERISRWLAGVGAGICLSLAYTQFTTNTHLECTEKVRSADGYECVGDYKKVEGASVSSGMLLIALFIFTSSLAIRKQKSDMQ